MNPDSILKLC